MPDRVSDDQIPWFIRMEIFKRDFEIGDPLAVDRCVLACAEGKAPVPDWAMPELVARSEVRLGLTEAPRSRGGPHSNPHNLSEDLHKRIAVVCMVLAAEERGLRGEQKYEIAKAALDEYGVPLEVETIKRYRSENRTRAKKSTSVYWDEEALRKSWAIEQFRGFIDQLVGE